MLERADAIRERRQARQWEEIRRRREEREALEREARKRHLAAVAAREGEVWKEVHDLIATRAPKSYDSAVRHLVDLREVPHEQGGPRRCSGGWRTSAPSTAGRTRC